MSTDTNTVRVPDVVVATLREGNRASVMRAQIGETANRSSR